MDERTECHGNMMLRPSMALKLTTGRHLSGERTTSTNHPRISPLYYGNGETHLQAAVNISGHQLEE